jgi:hypothetical protein
MKEIDSKLQKIIVFPCLKFTVSPLCNFHLSLLRDYINFKSQVPSSNYYIKIRVLILPYITKRKQKTPDSINSIMNQLQCVN